jgi:hypothetical protein
MKTKLWEGVLFVLVINFFVIPLGSLAITERAICWPHRALLFYGLFLEVIRKMRGHFRPDTPGCNEARRNQRGLGSARLHPA